MARKKQRQTTVYIPEKIKRAVKRVADRERRSFSAQVATIIVEWLGAAAEVPASDAQ